MQRAEWFDGRTASSRWVEVRPAGDGIELIEDGGVIERVARPELIVGERGSDRIRLARQGSDGWRLRLDAPFDPDVLAALPRRALSDPSVRTRPMMIAIGLTALVSAGLGLIVLAPQAVATHMPMAWEKRLGSIYDVPSDWTQCESPAAQQALDTLVDRLDPTARKEGFRIRLLDVDEVNAAALPGQRMIVFNGLFEQVDDADALAGIVAHELAHVRRRHVAAGIVRQLGIGTVVTIAGGGAVAGNGGTLVSLRFTREAEAEADRDAIAMLQAARIDPAKTKLAFDNFRRMELNLPEWISSHPASAARGQRFAAAHDPRIAYRPALDPAAAKRLFAACSEEEVDSSD